MVEREKEAKKRSLSSEPVFLGGRLKKVAPLVIFYTTERSTAHCSAMMINKYTLHSSHGEEGDGARLESEDDDEKSSTALMRNIKNYDDENRAD